MKLLGLQLPEPGIRRFGEAHRPGTEPGPFPEPRLVIHHHGPLPGHRLVHGAQAFLDPGAVAQLEGDLPVGAFQAVEHGHLPVSQLQRGHRNLLKRLPS